MSIYIASKTKHAPKWRELRAAGYPIIATWIDEARPGQSVDLIDLPVRCVDESVNALVFVLYCEPGEILKGELIEVGARLGAGKTVYMVGSAENWPCAFAHHPRWWHRASVEEVLHGWRGVSVAEIVGEHERQRAHQPDATPDSTRPGAEATDGGEAVSERVAPVPGQKEAAGSEAGVDEVKP